MGNQFHRSESQRIDINETLKQMLSVVPDMISVQDLDMNIIYSNWQGFAAVPESKRLTGTKCYTTYRGIQSVCPDCRASEVLRTGKPVRAEAELPDGRWFDIRVIPITNDSGEIYAFMEWVRDITNEKLAVQSEKANATLLRIAGETARFGGWSVNLETNVCFWSDAVAEIHGMPRGFSPSVDEGISFYAPEWRNTIRKAFTDCARKGIPYNEELEIINSSGEKVWVKTIGVPVRNEEGNIVRVQGSFQDISDIRKTEEELRRKTERMDFLLKATSTNINIIDPDYNLKFVDQRWQEIYGDYHGRKCYEYFMDCRRPCSECGIPEALETGETVVTEEYLLKEGRFIEVHTIPFTDGEGKPAVAEFNIDITKRKQAEEEKEKLRFQLLQSRKIESVGRLAGGVAHDFNNMLAVILGNAEMALEELEPDQPLHEELQEIRKAAERSAKLTRQLLTFARKQTIKPELIDLNETVDGMLKMLKRLVGENIRVNWNPEKNIPPVMMDPSQVDQLMANLVVNARDAVGKAGEINIGTNLTRPEETVICHGGKELQGDHVLLTVSDTGCGMDRDTLEHLFEPFYTTKLTGQGTGLGLATVYGIVKQNNGHIKVESREGKGTTFSIYLPGKADGLTEPSNKVKTCSPEGGGETILLVEDEESVLNLTKAILERLGYRVITAGNPGEAIRVAEETGMDLLLTDVIMPGMNGKELEETLRQKHSGLRSLFMSGYSADVIAGNSKRETEEGINFIRKPFTVVELDNAVRKALESPPVLTDHTENKH